MNKKKPRVRKRGEAFGPYVNSLLTDYYQRGMIASMAIILLAYYNTADDYVEEDKQAEFFKKMEEETNRIMSEEISKDYTEMSEVAVSKIIEVRRKYGMEELDS